MKRCSDPSVVPGGPEVSRGGTGARTTEAIQSHPRPPEEEPPRWDEVAFAWASCWGLGDRCPSQPPVDQLSACDRLSVYLCSISYFLPTSLSSLFLSPSFLQHLISWSLSFLFSLPKVTLRSSGLDDGESAGGPGGPDTAGEWAAGALDACGAFEELGVCHCLMPGALRGHPGS